jgi:hypothetical protein
MAGREARSRNLYNWIRGGGIDKDLDCGYD